MQLFNYYNFQHCHNDYNKNKIISFASRLFLSLFLPFHNGQEETSKLIFMKECRLWMLNWEEKNLQSFCMAKTILRNSAMRYSIILYYIDLWALFILWKRYTGGKRNGVGITWSRNSIAVEKNIVNWTRQFKKYKSD